MIGNKTRIGNVLITGGVGFLGLHLTKKILEMYKDTIVTTVSRNEHKIHKAKVKIGDDRFKPVVLDIRNSDGLRDHMRGINCLIHLAAMKHIDLCETNVTEAISINIIGTMNLLRLFDGDTFIGMSTDKALEPRGCYGATKLLLETLTLEKASYHQDRRYMIVRSGNIFGSSGSVVEKWREQIRQNNEIVATGLNTTRFFIGVDRLVDFIIEVLEHGENGKVYIPFQKAIELKSLAKAVIELSGNQDTKVKEIALRPGEKEHEVLFLDNGQHNVVTTLTNSTSESAERMDLDEIKGLANKYYDV